MKKSIIALSAIIIFHLNSFSQLFDATIDGAIPGAEKEILAHFEKKGYAVVKDISYPKELVFMMGILKPDGIEGKKYPVLLHMTKGQSSDQIQSIVVYFPLDTRKEFDQHVKRFQEKFGASAISNHEKAEWHLANYNYVIGVEDRSVYHEVRVK
jgi:hypothetical protein